MKSVPFGERNSWAQTVLPTTLGADMNQGANPRIGNENVEKKSIGSILDQGGAAKHKNGAQLQTGLKGLMNQ
jgi:hypothetical protein